MSIFFKLGVLFVLRNKTERTVKRFGKQNKRNSGVYRIRLAAFGVDCMSRMIVGLVKHRLKQ